MMKKIKYIALSLGLVFAFSCELAETNVDPTQLQKVDLRLSLPEVISQTAYNQSANQARIPGIIMQQFFGLDAQQLAYNDYNFPEETTNNWWRTGAYAGSLKSASVIIEKANEEGQSYYGGIAKIMMAESYGMLTMFMGDIPFSDALKGTESLKPVYDTQEQVWQGILNMLDDAISDLSQAPVAGAPAGDDLIFGGDAQAWIKTAHALKARYYIQGTKRDNGAAAQALQEVNQAFSSVDEAPFFYYDVSEIGNNPLAKFGKERPATLGIDERFAQQMSDKADPRQPFYMNEAAGSWEYFNSTLPNLVWAQDDSAIPLISYAELMFIKAEALLRTGGSDADVQQALKDGIAASMEQVGLAADDYMTYVDTYGDLSGLGTTEEKLQLIIEEAYFAYFGYAFQQTWNNFRRTGYPNLQPSALGSSGLNPSGVIPRRMLYPVSEVQTNSENLNAAKGRQKGALLDADIWLFE